MRKITLVTVIATIATIAAIATVILLLSGYSYSQSSTVTVAPVNGMCVKGNTFLSAFGIPTTNPAVGSFPSCTVTVYLTGTTTLATLYSNASATPTPLSNPFTANLDSSWLFYAASGVALDVTMSGGTPFVMPSPYTLTGIIPTSAGLAPPPGAFSVLPLALPYGNVAIGASSTLTEQLTNYSLSTVTGIVLSLVPGANPADFAISSTTCGGSLAVNATCAVTIAYTPSIVGVESATLVVTDSSITSPQTVGMTGTGYTAPPPPGQFSCTPPLLPFSPPSVLIGTVSSPLTVICANNTTGTVSGISIAPPAGTNATDFSLTPGRNFCGTLAVPVTLITGTNCIFQVQFSPTFAGQETANTAVTETSPAGTQTVALSGTGYSAPPTPVNLNFTNGGGQGSGNVNTLTGGSPDGNVSCSVQLAPPTSGQCSSLNSYPSGTVVNFSATPSGGSTFGGWGGIPCSNPCSYPLTTNTTVSVVFNPPASAAPVALVQLTNLISVGRFSQPQTAGDMNLVAFLWQDNTNTITGVTDTAGNVYSLIPGFSGTKAGTAGSSTISQDFPACNNGLKNCTINYSAGDLVIVVCYLPDALGASCTITNTGGTGGSPVTWKTTSLRPFTGNEDQTLFYYIMPTAATGDTITAAPAPGSPRIAAVAFKGALQNVNAVLDAADNSYANATVTALAMACPAITTVGANDMIFAAFADASTGGSGWTANGSWAIIPGTLDKNFAFSAADQLNIGVGTYTPKMNGSTTDNWQCIAAPFVSAAGGSTPGLSLSVYYSSGSSGIAASAAGNTVTPTWASATGAGLLYAAYEYSGLQNGSGAIDNGGTAALANGTGTTAPSGTVTTSYANDLLFGATNALAMVSGGASGFTARFPSPGNSLQVEDNYAVGAGTYPYTPTLASSVNWISGQAAFKGSAAAPPPPVSESVQLTCVGGTGSGQVQTTVGGLAAVCSQGSGSDSASVMKGSTISLTAIATPPSTFGGFTGGGCSSNPSCGPITVNGPLTVNAVFNNTGTAYTIRNQPPPQVAFYGGPNSVTTHPLPPDWKSHLAGGSTLSNTIAVQTLTGGQGGGVSNAVAVWATPGSDDKFIPLYYAAANDPYFKAGGCSYTAAFPGLPAFRAPNNAPFNSISSNGSQSDGNLRVWDQTSGVVYGSYVSKVVNVGNPPLTIGNSTAQNPSGAPNAGTGSGCGAVANFYTSQDWSPFPGVGSGSWNQNQGAEGSMNLAPFAGIVRSQEMIQGYIGHALLSNFSCDGLDPSGSGLHHVFPAIEDTTTCGSTANMAPNGALIATDYALIPGALTTVCAAVPAWECTLITAMSTYGSYVSPTSRESGVGMNFYGESGFAYWVQTGGTYSESSKGLTIPWTGTGSPFADPVFGWLQNTEGIACGGSSGTSNCKYNLPWFSNIPNINGTDVTHHIFMVDPCIVKRYANQPGQC